jgi:hypothetical protein
MLQCVTLEGGKRDDEWVCERSGIGSKMCTDLKREKGVEGGRSLLLVRGLETLEVVGSQDKRVV